MKRLITALVVLTVAGGCAQKPKADPDYVAEIEKARQQREERLRSEDNWLSVVGLDWLKPGPNTIGSAKDNAIVLPEPAAAHAGTIVLEGDNVRFEPSAESNLTVDGTPVAAMALAPDVSGNPTVLRAGSVSLFVIKRGDRTGVRVKDANSEARRNFEGLGFFDVDQTWRVTARLEPADPPREIPIVNIIGLTEPAKSPGTLVFERDGKTFRLDPIVEEGSTDLFIIFADRTNGRDTYGAGRYLYADAPDASGNVVLDFNRAQNPPCAFTRFATCPLPPKQNRMNVAVNAGEKAPKDH